MDLQRIGHPSQAFHQNGVQSSGDEENKTPKIVAPTLFAIPSKDNYNASGFGKPSLRILDYFLLNKLLFYSIPFAVVFISVHCCVVRCGNNRYHFSFQVGGLETVSIIANKVSKFTLSFVSSAHTF